MALVDGAVDTFQTFGIGFYQFVKPHLQFTYVLRHFIDPATNVAQVIENQNLDFRHGQNRIMSM